MKKLSLVLGLVLTSLVTLLSQRTITGTVTDQQGDALIGATILVEGTTVGTVTDVDGNYSLEVPAEGQTLIFSYTGFKSQEVPIAASNVIDVQMESDVIGLEDVIVIGYVPQKRKEITGAVASVSGDALNREQNVTVQTALRGRAAGVTVTQSSGTPGSGIDVRVRGSSSITASNKPLYVVDGVPVIDENFAQEGVGNQGINSLADINPGDIASIEVLKDAATSAIYGSRAANGVVLITTKSGRAGKTQVNFNAAYGYNSPIKTIDVVDSSGYRDYLGILAGNRNAGAGALQGNSDWQDLIFDTRPQQNYGLSFSGGNDRTTFYSSLAYDDNQGTIIGSRFQRYSARVNLDNMVSDKFRFGLNLGYSNTINDRIQNDNNIYGALSTSFLLPPTVPVFNKDGSYGSAFGLENPVAATNEYQNKVRTNRVIGNMQATYRILDALAFDARLGIDALLLTEDVFEPSVLQSSPSGRLVNAYTNNIRLLNEYTLRWTTDFGRASLVAAATASFQKDDNRQLYTEKTDLPTDNFSAPDAGANPTTIDGDYSGDVLQSYIGNLNFAFDQRFFLTVSFRADGSSRFVDNKWGYFPGFSAAWDLSREAFLSNSGLDLFKLRVGYGVTGNNNIGNFTARQLFGGGANYLTQPGITPTQIGNPALRWESTSQFDVGLDIGLLNNRLGIVLDYYIKSTEDLLLDRPLPTTSGFTTVSENIGAMRNTGFEIDLTGRIVDAQDFNWTTRLTAAYNKNEIVDLYNDQPLDFGFATRLAEGQPLGSFYGWVTDGIFQTQAEVEAHARQTANTRPGDIRFRDLNNDGVINDEDRTFIGQALPAWTGGLDNTLSYKGLELNFFFQFSLGNEIFNNNLAFSEGLNGVFAPTVRAFNNAWRQEGDQTDIPRIVNGDPNNNRRDSDRFVENGSYVRLKTATLAYEFPNSLFGNRGVRRLRLYVSGTNLLTFTEYSWLDPEVNTFDGSNVALGTDFLTYPQPRTLVFGVNLGF